MDLAILRSQLQHACPSLRNITVAELSECRWASKRRIFEAILSSIDGNCLEALLDKRQRQLLAHRVANDSREVRFDSEMEFRTEFLRILLDRLTLLKWPPTMEAFSDPINDLLNNSNVVYSAMDYLLKVGMHRLMDVHSRGFTKEDEMFDENESCEYSYEGRTSERLDDTITQQQTSRGGEIPVSARSKSTSRTCSRPNSATSTRSMLGSPSLNSNISIQYAEQYLATPRTGDDTTLRTNSSYSERHDKPHRISAEDRFRDSKSLAKAYEILLHQNEALSRQVKQLQICICARDDTEAKMEALIIDLKTAIDEIVGIAKSERTNVCHEDEHTSKNRHNDQIASSNDRLHATKDTKESALGNASGGREPNAGSKTTIVTELSQLKLKPPVPMSRKDPSLMAIWVRLQVQVQGIKEQWQECRVVARKISIQQISSKSMHKDTRNSFVKRLEVVKQNLDVSSPCTARERGTFGVQNRMCSPTTSLSALNHIRVKARVKDGGGGKSSYDENDSECFTFTDDTRSLNSFNYNGNNVTNEEDIALDIQRVHLLQKDLITFADRAFECISAKLKCELEEDFGDNNSSESISCNRERNDFASNSLPIPPNGKNPPPANSHPNNPNNIMNKSKFVKALELLRQISQRLLLHLACMSPLAPITTSSVLSSSCTGLNALIAEATAASNFSNTKVSLQQHQQRLQAAADRARAEQTALLRCLHAGQFCLERWPAAAMSNTLAMNRIGKWAKSVYDQAVVEIRNHSQGLQSIASALQAAEEERVPKTSVFPDKKGTIDEDGMIGMINSKKSKSSVATTLSSFVSPLDALCKGSMGEKVAQLINAIRIHFPDICGGRGGQYSPRTVNGKVSTTTTDDHSSSSMSSSNLVSVLENLLKKFSSETLRESSALQRNTRETSGAVAATMQVRTLSDCHIDNIIEIDDRSKNKNSGTRSSSSARSKSTGRVTGHNNNTNNSRSTSANKRRVVSSSTSKPDFVFS